VTPLSLNENDKARLYELLWQHETDAIFVADARTGLILDANPPACALLGRPRSEVLFTSQAELHPAHERERAKEAFKAASDCPIVITGFHLSRSDGVEIRLRSRQPRNCR